MTGSLPQRVTYWHLRVALTNETVANLEEMKWNSVTIVFTEVKGIMAYLLS